MFDIGEFEKITEKYRKPLYRYCYYRLGGDKDAAEDVLGDVFIVLYRKWDELDVGENIRAYLYRVADNCIRQKKKHFAKKPPSDSYEELAEDHAFDGEAQWDEYFCREEADTEEYLQRVKDLLPPEYREIFELRYIRKMTLDDSAAALGMHYSTLRLRIKRLEPLIRDAVKKIFD